MLKPNGQEILEAYAAALDAVEPTTAVRRALRDRETTSAPLGRLVDRQGPVRLVAIGKAAAAMARGAMDVIADRIVEGIVVSGRAEKIPAPLEGIVGEHPFPGAGSEAAGNAALEIAGRCHDDEVLLVLISGGASSLAEVPVEGMTIDDLAELHRSLFASGTPIEEMNCVRRHMSRLKDGGLLRAARCKEVVSLLVSDVADAPASTIGSGPTLADGSSGADAQRILHRRLEGREVPSVVSRDLGAPAAEHDWRVIADGATAATAAMESFDESWNARVVTTSLSGEARVVATETVENAGPGVTILAGETTVTGAVSGLGGRNTEAALAAALAIDGRPGIVFAALTTDGVDGPTDAAGAVVDGGTVSRGSEAGLDAGAFLDRHDSYPFLEVTGDLVITGPSNTNVGDIWMLAVGDQHADSS